MLSVYRFLNQYQLMMLNTMFFHNTQRMRYCDVILSHHTKSVPSTLSVSK